MFRKKSSKLTDLGKREAVIGGRTVSYTVRRSPRARYIRLEVKADTGLTVVIPKSYNPDLIPDLIRKKEKWISDNLAKYYDAPEPGSSRDLKSGDSLPWLGRDMKLDIRNSVRGAESIRLEKDRILIHVAIDGSSPERLMEQWYRKKASQIIGGKARKYSILMGVKYDRLTIRGQRTRWGSCSHKGNLSFNWKLMMVPEPVVDYVVIHELAHLSEMNHSKKFWKLVERHCPGWRRHRKWLDSHTGKIVPPLFT